MIHIQIFCMNWITWKSYCSGTNSERHIFTLISRLHCYFKLTSMQYTYLSTQWTYYSRYHDFYYNIFIHFHIALLYSLLFTVIFTPEKRRSCGKVNVCSIDHPHNDHRVRQCANKAVNPPKCLTCLCFIPPCIFRFVPFDFIFYCLLLWSHFTGSQGQQSWCQMGKIICKPYRLIVELKK